MSDARAEGWNLLQIILTNIKARPTTCPADHPGRPRATPSSATHIPIIAGTNLALSSANSPRAALKETLVVSVNATLSSETPAGWNKGQIGCDPKEQGSLKRKKEKQGGTHYTSNKTFDVSDHPGEKDSRKLRLCPTPAPSLRDYSTMTGRFCFYNP